MDSFWLFYPNSYTLMSFACLSREDSKTGSDRAIYVRDQVSRKSTSYMELLLLPLLAS